MGGPLAASPAQGTGLFEAAEDARRLRDHLLGRVRDIARRDAAVDRGQKGIRLMLDRDERAALQAVIRQFSKADHAAWVAGDRVGAWSARRAGHSEFEG